jgi:hypothetical protein
MKSTIALLTALVVSASIFSTARAQEPIQPVGFGSKLFGGGCADGSCGEGCTDGSCGGKAHLFGKLCHGSGKDGCGTGGCGHKCCLFGWLCKPCPSTAPSCRKPEYPLGFPSSPYVRSPRDYFLDP